MAQATNTTSTSNKATKGASKAAQVQAPAQAATPFKGMLQQLAKQGAATASKASKGVQATATQAGNVAPVGVATRNAGKAATIPGFAMVGVNGRKQPLASSVTAQIWLAALSYQLANNGSMPTQAHIKLACPTVNPTSCGLGLTQYKAYTGQCKGMPVLAIAQLQAMAQAPAAPAPNATA